MWRLWCAVILCVSAVRETRVSNGTVVELTPGTHWYHQEPEPIKEKMLKGLGCYCMKVAAMDDCPNFKSMKSPTQPEKYRWYHPEVAPGEKKPHRCCKLAWTAWYNRVGWRYQRQASFELCTKEERPIPPEVCCRVGEGEQKVGIRIRKVEAVGCQEIPTIYSWRDKTFGKSYPVFALKDVTGATDYDGSTVSPAEAAQFLKNKVVAGLLGEDAVDSDPTTFNCQNLNSLLLDTGECHLRNQTPTECCCLEETIQEAHRCLPVPNNGASSATVGPLRVKGTYRNDTKLHGVVVGNISWPSDPEELEKDLPVLLKSKDPNVTNSLDFDWSPGSQWHAKCVLNQSVQYVVGKKKSKRVRSGTHFRRVNGITSSVPTYRTEYYMDYSQAEKPMCISYDYSRICPLGYGLYVKQLRPGVCTKIPGPSNKDSLQLEDIGGLTYRCPEKYRSGTEGALKFDQLCSCGEGC